MTRRRKGVPIHGWVVLDKPSGMSSARAVAAVRRHFDAAKAGHGGTLDPMATGVLPIALGEATKTVLYVMEAAKLYRFTVRWGLATDTDDSEGRVIAESGVRPGRDQIEAALPRFTGAIQQAPPAYSAIKIGGERAYALARGGDTVSLPPRPVEIASLRLIEYLDADHAVLEAEVGKGTYIRALARDLGHSLGTLGHISALRRLAVGRFRAERAISLEKLAVLGHSPAAFEHLLPVETVLDDIPALALTEAEAASLRHGQRVGSVSERALHCGLSEGATVCATERGKLVALAKIEGDELRPVRVMNFE
jgi:tRNA pseudouridine55 synthase